MKPIPSAWHEKVNWLNYKTGIKGIFFRMHADSRQVWIEIVFTHSDPLIRKIFFDHFVAMKGMMYESLGEEWDFIEETFDAFGKPISVIRKMGPAANIMEESRWPDLISFFKHRLIALDAFWADVRESMEGW